MNTLDPRNDIESYPLDDATLELMAETLQQIKAIHAIREGVLMLFVRQQHLSPGDWQLSANGKELVRAPQAQPLKTT